MSNIIYYNNLSYDQLPCVRKKQRTSLPTTFTPSSNPPTQASTIQLSSASSSSSSYSNKTILNRQSEPTSYHSSSSSSTTTNSISSDYPTKSSFTTASNYYAPPPPPSNNVLQTNNSQSYSYSSTSHKSKPAYVTNTPSNIPAPKYDRDTLHKTLREYFNFSSFRTNQLEVVTATCKGLDTLVLMPTGGGKSICYQLPAILSPGLTIVVSPLKSLIEDQVQQLRKRNIRTSALFGDTSESEASEIYLDLKSHEPEHKLLYVTPEKINASGALINLLHNLHSRNLLTRFVIDEAHCVSMWGSDFRPDYRKLGKLRDLFHDVPIMALTATAPPKVREDILDQLKMVKRHDTIFIQSFNRSNLKFEVRQKSKGCISEISKLIRNQFRNQCGIIYCLSRNDCENVAQSLRLEGIMGSAYHAGLTDNQRKKIFNAWSNGQFQVVCATIAFGMGIDKSGVRFVIHYSVPKSIEGYYQEAGRAGRDGNFASCILYYSKSDLYRMRSMLNKGSGMRRQAEDKLRDSDNLQQIVNYVDNKTECRRAILLRYLGENFDPRNCISNRKTACDNCLCRSQN